MGKEQNVVYFDSMAMLVDALKGIEAVEGYPWLHMYWELNQ